MNRKILGSQGFTLLELLVVVALIGVFSTLGLNAFTAVQQKSRDSQRKTDIEQIRIALELYRSDNSTYPSPAQLYTGGTCGAAFTSGTTTYMQKVPCNPKPVEIYVYTYTASTNSYVIRACLENANDKDGEAITGATGCLSNRFYRRTNP